MMPKYWLMIIFLIIAEVVLAFVFSVIAQIFYKKSGLDFRSIFKGTFERLFLVLALANDYPTAIVFFSALKLATRLKHEEPTAEHNKFNDYYLIGNLATVSVAILYVYLYKNFDNIVSFA